MDLLLRRDRRVRLKIAQLAQRLAVRLSDRLVGAVEDLVQQPDCLVLAEAQQRGIAQPIGTAGADKPRPAIAAGLIVEVAAA